MLPALDNFISYLYFVSKLIIQFTILNLNNLSIVINQVITLIIESSPMTAKKVNILSEIYLEMVKV